MSTERNVKQAIPFFGVENIQASLRFYVDGIGFEMTHKWIHEGKLRWCSLRLGEASLMLQEFWTEGPHQGRPDGMLGLGVSICFLCEDALKIYHEVKTRGLDPSRPFVGNGMWVTSLTDPDGYRIDFESFTDVPEDTVYSDQNQ